MTICNKDLNNSLYIKIDQVLCNYIYGTKSSKDFKEMDCSYIHYMPESITTYIHIIHKIARNTVV